MKNKTEASHKRENKKSNDIKQIIFVNLDSIFRFSCTMILISLTINCLIVLFTFCDFLFMNFLNLINVIIFKGINIKIDKIYSKKTK